MIKYILSASWGCKSIKLYFSNTSRFNICRSTWNKFWSVCSLSLDAMQVTIINQKSQGSGIRSQAEMHIIRIDEEKQGRRSSEVYFRLLPQATSGNTYKGARHAPMVVLIGWLLYIFYVKKQVWLCRARGMVEMKSDGEKSQVGSWFILYKLNTTVPKRPAMLELNRYIIHVAWC